MYHYSILGKTLTQPNLRASVGTTGDSYDNALAETVNGLYKTEVIEYWLCCTNLSVKGFSAI